MGRGRFHFRFKDEADLQKVLDNRPYHFEGWMIGLDRWVPTVRLDYPSTIPFWIRILDLPDMFVEGKQVVRIGEDIGELLNWSLEEPVPMVQVMVECEAPLTLFRETVSEQGELFRIRFEYLKLQNHCKSCYKMTHDSRNCPARLGPNRNHWDRKREPSRRWEEEEGRRGKRAGRVAVAPALQTRNQNMITTEAIGSLKKKPVRQNLTEGLGDTLLEAEESRVAKRTTKEWVPKSFPKEVVRGGTVPVGAPPADEVTQTGGSGIRSNSWYRNSEEEAKVAKLIYAQNEIWAKGKAPYRESEKVEKEPQSDQRGQLENRQIGTGDVRATGNRRADLIGKGLEGDAEVTRQGGTNLRQAMGIQRRQGPPVLVNSGTGHMAETGSPRKKDHPMATGLPASGPPDGEGGLKVSAHRNLDIMKKARGANVNGKEESFGPHG